MYKFYIKGITNIYHYDALCRAFLGDGDFKVIPLGGVTDKNLPSCDPETLPEDDSFVINECGSTDRDAIKRELYEKLRELTGTDLRWGTLTGVKPLKLAQKSYSELGATDGDPESRQAVTDDLGKRYFVTPEKAGLLCDISEYRRSEVCPPPQNSISLYAGIPFCPTRCRYCSFSSTVAEGADIDGYLECLKREIIYTGERASATGMKVESLYIGGGTPTTLTPAQMENLLYTLEKAFSIDPQTAEITVEAGRPDTIDEDILKVIKDAGRRRISINPQSTDDITLKRIGRAHTSKDLLNAFEIAGRVGFETVNSDVIAGLEGETVETFEKTLRDVISLGAGNVTVHTLSVKRGSRLKEEDPYFYKRNEETAVEMLARAREILGTEGFYPYYIYRQKHQIGGLENVGYCKRGRHSIYNIRIMDEDQTLIALGAGGVGKKYFKEDDHIERIPNVSDPKVYCERIDEMIARKNGFFGG